MVEAVFRGFDRACRVYLKGFCLVYYGFDTVFMGSGKVFLGLFSGLTRVFSL